MYSVHIKNLNVKYQDTRVLNQVNLRVPRGVRVGIIGPNGAGKSTLIKAILNLIPSDAEEITFLGKKFDHIKKEIAYVPQRETVDWSFPISLEEVVMMGRYGKLGLFKRPKEKDHLVVSKVLEQVNLTDLRKQQIGQLSGGQQQRTFVARALAQEPEIYFMDEPFVGVDVPTEEIIVDLLKDITASGKTVFIVHHDLNKAKDYFDYIILLNKEIIAAGYTEDVWRPEFITKCFGAGVEPLLQPNI